MENRKCSRFVGFPRKPPSSKIAVFGSTSLNYFLTNHKNYNYQFFLIFLLLRNAREGFKEY